MRAIKFRAWDLDRRAMITDVGVSCSGGQPMKYCELSGRYEDIRGIRMQFTSAYDTDCNEIYVDDIVRVDGSGECLVKICTYYGVVFVGKDGSEVALIDCLAEQDSFYVIGNVHQNPELIK